MAERLLPPSPQLGQGTKRRPCTSMLLTDGAAGTRKKHKMQPLEQEGAILLQRPLLIECNIVLAGKNEYML